MAAPAQHRVPADRLAARKIGRFLRFGISTIPSVGGVGEGRKAAAEHWSLGRTLPSVYEMLFGSPRKERVLVPFAPHAALLWYTLSTEHPYHEER
jgi:hypothetical protein